MPCGTSGYRCSMLPENLAKHLFRTGAHLRNPGLYPRYRLLKQSERWPLDRLLDFQLRACRSLLIFAHRHSPFYRARFRKVGFDPGQMNHLEDLQQIPIISKQELLTHHAAVHTRYPFRRTFLSETSGTSGQVLAFRKNEAWDSANRAALMRAYSWYGLRPWAYNIYFWGYDPAPRQRLRTRLLDRLQNRYRIFSYAEADWQQVLLRLPGAVYLHGYSSMIYETAKRAGPQAESPRLKLVKGTSEQILPAYRTAVEEAFGQPLRSEYGAAEAGLIAFECPAGRLHLQSEGVVVEEVGGEIVVTNLHAYSFPIIRYALGDRIALDRSGASCPCGMAHPLLKEVIGRAGDTILGKGRRYPALVLYNIFKNLFFQTGDAFNYQGIQTEPGLLILAVEQELTADQCRRIRAECAKYFGQDVRLEIRPMESQPDRREKRRYFVSRVNTRE